MSNRPLPRGWVQQHDPSYNRAYWVDTRASPPRAIWVHPYEDQQFLGEHPEIGEEGATFTGFELDAPPPYDVVTRTLGSEGKSGSLQPNAVSEGGSHKRGMFGRWRDKAIGTKEEREEHKRVRAQQAARADEEARWARMRQLEEREAYMRAHGGYAPYHPSYGRPPANGLGMDSTAALLLGGLAGGLLLGDIFGGGF